MYPSKLRCLLALVALVPLLAAGPCTVEIVPSDGNGGGGNNGGNTPPPSTAITVRIINNTDRPLNPQVFVGPVAGGADHLFDNANHQTRFGVGNTGYLTAGDEGTFTITCGDPVYIGTKGGVFGDDLTDPVGRGQQIVLQEDVNVRCGEIVTFMFNNTGNTLIVGYGVTPE
jgi:hypothetical protein